MNAKVDQYLIDGCMRCAYGGTADCKVHLWHEHLVLLRSILNETELTEELKWSVPCYTLNGKNVLLLSAFKDYCAISFFKGALIKDDKGLLEKPGPNSYTSRLLKITDINQIIEWRPHIISYIIAAINNEKDGLKYTAPKDKEPIPEELSALFDEDPTFKNAFYNLTPGRQRGYIIFFSAPKQSKTRISRIKKYEDQILRGEGMHDAYRKKGK